MDEFKPRAKNQVFGVRQGQYTTYVCDLGREVKSWEDYRYSLSQKRGNKPIGNRRGSNNLEEAKQMARDSVKGKQLNPRFLNALQYLLGVKKMDTLIVDNDFSIKILEDKLIVNGMGGFEKFIIFVSQYCEKGIDLYLPKTEFHFKPKTSISYKV